MIAEDAVWRVPGTVSVAQEYRGREEIFGLFRETRRLTDGTYLSELRWALADGDHAVAVYRARGRRLGRELDIDQVLLIGLHEGAGRRSSRCRRTRRRSRRSGPDEGRVRGRHVRRQQ